jgi:diguanylate cyclase (GGDEF)-like protein
VTVLDRQRVLVVEDDPEFQYLLSTILAGERRDVVGVATGSEARDVLDREAVDFVILDLILPDVDGRSLLAELRARPETAALPVVVVTARAGPDTRQECYALGADAFVEKPFDPEVFAADMSVRLERAALAERIAFTDSLSGLLNRAGLQAACAEAHGGYALGLLELDAFGVRSERWGWDRTEQVERDLATALRTALPETVRLARIGGGDFALFVLGADLAAVSEVAGRALDVVRTLTSEVLDGDAEKLTATIGVMTAESGALLDESLDVARRRIFQAREGQGDHVISEDVGESRSARVVVAEDDEISATILVHRLEKEGLDVTRFDNGQQAYEAVLAETPDLVILDVKMPGLDGFEVLQRLRKSPRLVGTPVIMLTSMGQEADVVRGFRLGADDYILKPFSPTELSARVRRLLRRGRSRSAV